jgi:hypothetical protein
MWKSIATMANHILSLLWFAVSLYRIFFSAFSTSHIHIHPYLRSYTPTSLNPCTHSALFVACSGYSLTMDKHTEVDNKENLNENGNNNNNNHNNHDHDHTNHTHNNTKTNDETDTQHSDPPQEDQDTKELEGGVGQLGIAEPSNFSVKHPLQNSWTIWYPFN